MTSNTAPDTSMNTDEVYKVLFEFLEQYVSLSDDERAALVSADVIQFVKGGEILIHEGEVVAHGFFVLKGCLRSYYNIHGDEKTTGFCTELENLTPTGLLDGEPSQHFVSALEDSIIIAANKNIEEAVLSAFPKFEKVCRKMAEETVIKQQIDFDTFKTTSPEERYLTLLEKRPDLLQRVSQNHIANYIGITPQSLSRLKSRIFKRS